MTRVRTENAPDRALNLLTSYDLETGSRTQVATDVAIPFDHLSWVDDETIIVVERFTAPTFWRVGAKIARGEAIEARGDAIDVSPNGRYIVIYDGGGGIRVYARDGLALVWQADEPLHLKRGGVRFARRGRILASGGGILSLWETGLDTD